MSWPVVCTAVLTLRVNAPRSKTGRYSSKEKETKAGISQRRKLDRKYSALDTNN